MKNIFTFLLLLLTSISYAQVLYDLKVIQSIDVEFAESNWDQLLDVEYAGSGGYIMAKSVTINGVKFDSVGVKYKGNSSYNPNQVKNPWHIELDTYKDQEYDGYTDIKLANGAKDPSFLRDVLAYQVLREYMDAPLANYANLTVNGTLIGLYSNVESISKKFMQSRFGSKNNTRFKCSPPDGASPQSNDFPNLVYLGQDSTAYYDAYELKSDAGWQELIDLCDTLENHISEIEKILDVDRALWMLAFDNAIVNLDSYIGTFSQNYYLYRSDYDQFMPIVWDLNESFGVFAQTGTINLNNTTAKQQMTPLLHENDNGFPLVRQLLSVPMYKRMYLAHYKTLLLENFSNDSYYTKAQTLQTLIGTAVQADNNKFFTYDDFINNLSADISSGGPGGGPGGGGPGGSSTPGIANLMDGRTDYLLGLTAFTQTAPTISTPILSNPNPVLSETINISSTIEDGNTVLLGYRSEATAPFTRIQMYDDGAHNDGAANDGVYGIDLRIIDQFIQYYIYAENDDAGKFSPQRAEYEYHTITTAPFVTTSDLVINEFMASNEATAIDQDGEFEDWIELYNNGTDSIDLSGYFLTDDEQDLTQWQFPEGTKIAGNGYLIIWADDDGDQSGLHANFKLSASGETLTLLNAADTSIVDQVIFGAQTTDVSYGRIPNGTGDFASMNPTFNAENIITTLSDLVINEFMASNDASIADQDGEFEDWIELYNNGTDSIDLSGYFLTDDEQDLTQWQFPEGTKIAGNGYLIIWADDDGDQSGLHANFKLSASGETLTLLNAADTSILDQVIFGAQTTDVSYGRIPNGTGDFASMNPTFNAENTVTTAVDNVISQENTLSVYPNPTSGAFYLENSDNNFQERLVSIYNLNGTLFYQNKMTNNLWINASEWPAGMYIIRSDASVLKLIID